MNWLDLILTSASNTFIQVGTFVGITLLIFGYINYKSHGGFLYGFQKHKHLQVIFGSLLGLTPGCGGAIMVMPLFLKGHVSFGTVVATLIATMGDAAFVLMVRNPLSFIWVLVISFVTALITGYIIDFLGIGKNIISSPYSEQELESIDSLFQKEEQEYASPQSHSKLSYHLYLFRHQTAYIVFWIFIILAFPLGILNLMQVDFNNTFPVKNLGIIGTVGTIFSVFYSILCKKFVQDDMLPEIKSKQHSLTETFIHNAEETAFVIMWVFVAIFIYDTSVYLIGGEEVIAAFMTKTGYIAVLIALLIGLIPGCGAHIILATLYTQGLIPFSALITNAICNDGDALFPLLATHKKSALWVTIFSTIPALIVGTIVYLLGY